MRRLRLQLEQLRPQRLAAPLRLPLLADGDRALEVRHSQLQVTQLAVCGRPPVVGFLVPTVIPQSIAARRQRRREVCQLDVRLRAVAVVDGAAWLAEGKQLRANTIKGEHI